MKLTKLKMLSLTFLFLSCSMLGDDKKLGELEKKFKTAKTQSELNITSYKLSQHWDEKLKELQKKVKVKLNKESLVLFINSSKSWQTYRAAQVKFAGNLYKGGSIQPLIHNTTHMGITKTRIQLLKVTLEELNR
jgi:uncharacterized protein YecT (DUF1311 family)